MKISDTFKKVAGYRLAGFDFYQDHGLSEAADQVYFIPGTISEKIEVIRFKLFSSHELAFTPALKSLRCRPGEMRFASRFTNFTGQADPRRPGIEMQEM